jgi:hypothetical protein
MINFRVISSTIGLSLLFSGPDSSAARARIRLPAGNQRMANDPYLTNETFELPHQKREVIGLAAVSETKGAGKPVTRRPTLQMKLLTFSSTIARLPLSRLSTFRQGQST